MHFAPSFTFRIAAGAAVAAALLVVLGDEPANARGAPIRALARAHEPAGRAARPEGLVRRQREVGAANDSAPSPPGPAGQGLRQSADAPG